LIILILSELRIGSSGGREGGRDEEEDRPESFSIEEESNVEL